MAKQASIIKIEGTLQDLVFYKTKDGYFVKTKISGRGELIKRDARFVRVRENGSEFGAAVKSGMLLRNALAQLIYRIADNRLTPRLTQLMSGIQKLDAISKRGMRRVGVAFDNSSDAVNMLKGFDFNINSSLSRVLQKPFDLDNVTGTMTITNLVPTKDIFYPENATHVVLRTAFASIDFTNKVYDLSCSAETIIPINDVVSTLVLTPANFPTVAGTNIYLLQIKFIQEVNGVRYSLHDDGFNAMGIVGAG
ncbi:MAG: hypothetical protein ABI723_10550 [Bacteroidia bacterium]